MSGDVLSIERFGIVTAIPKSEKNYLAVAEERGTKFGSPAIQGGLAGLEKK